MNISIGAELFLPTFEFLGLGQDVDIPAGQLEASRTFWPRRPMARLSWSSGTTTSMRFCFLVQHHLGDFGRGQPVDDEGGRILDHWMMSIFSPCSSATTAWTRVPRMPTQAPTGSIRSRG